MKVWHWSNLSWKNCTLTKHSTSTLPSISPEFPLANKTTILPRGGGPDGQSPVLIPKGSGVGWSSYHLHRLESIYGPDSRVYRPQRWEDGELIKKAGLGSGFVDFNAGPRVCLGSNKFHFLALSYTVSLTLHRGFCSDGGKLRGDQNTTNVSQYSTPA